MKPYVTHVFLVFLSNHFQTVMCVRLTIWYIPDEVIIIILSAFY